MLGPACWAGGVAEMGASGRIPKSPRGRDWGGRVEGKVRTHLLAWLALYSLGQPHATQGGGGGEKRKDERGTHKNPC